MVGVVLTVSGFAFAAYNESHDDFCASCHTQPETTFYQRSIAAHPTDLASAHTASKVLCIDCHSGVGITGHLQAEVLGARNATAWLTNTAAQPSSLTYPLTDDHCLKCHQDLNDESHWAHYHAFLPDWRAKDPTHVAACVTCHNSHITNGNASDSFLNEKDTRKVCDSCHLVLHKKGK